MSTAQTGWSRYVAQWAAHNGGYDLRRAPAAVRRWQQAAYAVGRLVVATRLPAGVVTLLVLAAAVAVPVLAGRGGWWPLAAAAAVLLSTFAGAVDAAVTVLTGHTGAAATIRDAVTARLRELAWLLALWLLGAPGPLLVACGAVTWLHEFVRAHALAARVSRIGLHTLGDPAMRVGASCAGLALAALAGENLAAGVVAVAAAVWLLLAALGLGQLVSAVRRVLR